MTYEIEKSDKLEKSDKVAKDFIWVDQTGISHTLESMTTHHVFYTIKMIWNHVVPPELQLKPFKQYNLGPQFTNKFCRRAVDALLAELKTRDDFWLYLNQINQIQENMIEYKK